MLDCQWIQCLHSCGLLNGSYRPHESICQWRTLARALNRLEREKEDWIRRIQKCLNEMNIQLHHAVADITGVTGMTILRAIVDGERDPIRLARMRDRRCKKNEEQIAEHLTGNWRDEHLFVLKKNLSMYDTLCSQIEDYRQEIMRIVEKLQPEERVEAPVPEVGKKEKRLRMRKRGDEPMREALYRFSGVDLTAIDAISSRTAESILSELGLGLETFPDENHFVAYLNLAPKLARSGGKPIKKRRHHNATSRVGQSLRQAASTLRNSKSALGAEFRRIMRKKGFGVAVFAMARKLAILVYRMLKWGQAYVDEGLEAYEARFDAARFNACKENAKALGYKLLPIADAEVCA
jgi:transposase